jgi:hypothetical protein
MTTLTVAFCNFADATKTDSLLRANPLCVKLQSLIHTLILTVLFLCVHVSACVSACVCQHVCQLVFSSYNNGAGRRVLPYLYCPYFLLSSLQLLKFTRSYKHWYNRLMNKVTTVFVFVFIRLSFIKLIYSYTSLHFFFLRLKIAS